MDYKINKKEKNVVELSIKLNKEEWEKELDSAYVRTRNKYKIEGFRNGKAPRKVIEKMYGNSVFYEEALSESFYKAYMEILNKEKDLQPVDAPNLDVQKVDENGLELLAKIAVKPDVIVEQYKGLDIQVKEPKVTKAQLDAELDRIKEQNARFVEKEGEIVVGDIANINFSGSVDGVKFEGGEGENYDLEIGSHTFIEGFEDQLVGLKANDEKDVKVTFPKEYHVAELANKPAVFAVKVNTVKQKQYPELNDEFASDVSEFETFAEYKKDVEKNLLQRLKENAKTELETKILDKIVANTKVDIPEIMIDNEVEEIIKDMEYRLMYQGLNLETYAKYMNTTIDDIKKERRADAKKSVTIRLALSYILEKESIDVKNSEVDEKIKEMAKSANKTIKEFKENMPEDRINYIKNDILMNKLLNFLIENNTAKELK